MGRGAFLVAAIAAALAFALYEGGHPWPSLASHAGILAAIAVVWAAVAAAGRGRQRLGSKAWWGRLWHGLWRRPDRSWWGGAGWVLAAMLVAGYDLASFLARSPELPTLSRLIGGVTRYYAGRAVAIGLWLGLGGWIALGGRRPVGRA
jgi:hypothetical protein